MLPTTWTTEGLEAASAGFEGRAPEDALRWAVENFAPDISLATGFGPEGVVLMHLLSQIAPETPIFYLDTGLLFPETFALRDELEGRLGLRFTRVDCGLSVEAQAAEYGPALWS